MTLPSLLQSLRSGLRALSPVRAARDRRGVSAIFFAISATVLLAMSGLATEMGVWYFSLRTSRNAADAGAMAGAAAHARYGRDAGLRAAAQAATANGYTQGADGTTVTINNPPATGTYTGATGVYEVIITRTQFAALTRLVGNFTPTVTTRAVAGTVNAGKACVLALGNPGSSGLDLDGSATLDATTCVFASNMPGSRSIDVGGQGSDINLLGLRAYGGCNGCTQPNVTLGAFGIQSQAPQKLEDPYVALQSFAQPTTQTGSGNNQQLACFPTANQNNPTFFASGNTVRVDPRMSIGGGQTRPTAFCGGNNNNSTATWSVNNSQILEFTPGVYYFFNSTFNVNGGATVRCVGCDATAGLGVTLVFTGAADDKVGTISVNGNATFQLHAGSNQPNPLNVNESYAGVLIYRDDRAICNGGGGGCSGSWSTTNINGNSSSFYNGAIYMPSSDIQYSGNATVDTTNGCNVIVANSVQFTGNVSYGGCDRYGTKPMDLSTLRLLE